MKKAYIMERRGWILYGCLLHKLCADDNMLVSFWNQEVFNTALESWALALQESTNKNFEAWRWWKRNNIENQRFSQDYGGWDAFYWMSNNINMPSGSETKTENKQFTMKNKPFVNMQWEGPSKSFFSMYFGFGYFWFSRKSFLTMDIFGSIIWFVFIFTQFHFIVLQNKMFESWIATEAL